MDKDKEAKIIEMLKKGHKYDEIASVLNTSKSTIASIKREALGGVAAKKIKKTNSTVDSTVQNNDEVQFYRPSNSKNKELLKRYVLSINKGHKDYERHGFNDAHEFLLAVLKLIDEL